MVREAKARAIFMRAFCYEKLLSLYCRPEAPETPGLALLTHYDPLQRLTGRASQQQVYDLLFQDLSQAEQLLNEVDQPGE